MKQADIVKGDKYAVKIGQDLSVAHYVGHDQKKKQGRFKMATGGIKCVPYQSVKAIGQTSVAPATATVKTRPSPSKKPNKVPTQDAAANQAASASIERSIATMDGIKQKIDAAAGTQEANGHAEAPTAMTGGPMMPHGFAQAIAASFDRLFGNSVAQQPERRFPRRGDMVALVFHKECIANGGGLDIDSSGSLIEKLLSLDANGWRTVHAGLYDQDPDFRARFLPPAPAYV